MEQPQHDHHMMDHDHATHHHDEPSLKKYAPLITAFALVVLWTVIRGGQNEFSPESVMQDFMAGFFIIFGLLKVVSWKGFIESFRRYDILAKKIKFWAPLYPIIELVLGASFLWRVYPLATNAITLLIMVPASLGVYQALKRGQQIQCACIGSFFTIPLSWFTLLEDLLMVVMSATMLARML